MDKNQKEERRRQEDIALNRGLMWVGGAIVLECLLLLVNRYYINYYTYEVDTAILVHSALTFVRIGGALAALAALIWTALKFRKGEKAALPLVAALAAAAVTLCAHVTLIFDQAGMQMLLMLIPALAGLALVFYLYQREFFVGGAVSGLSVLGLWFIRFGGLKLEAVLCVAGVAAIALAVLWLKKQGGVISRADGSKLRLLSKKTNYPLVLASCGVGLAAMLVALVAGGGIAYYLIFAMVAWLFALLVYYTVKLM